MTGTERALTKLTRAFGEGFTPEDIAQRTEPELLRIRGFGRTSLNATKRWLAEHGLTLRSGGSPFHSRIAEHPVYRDMLSLMQQKGMTTEIISRHCFGGCEYSEEAVRYDDGSLPFPTPCLMFQLYLPKSLIVWLQDPRMVRLRDNYEGMVSDLDQIAEREREFGRLIAS